MLEARSAALEAAQAAAHEAESVHEDAEAELRRQLAGQQSQCSRLQVQPQLHFWYLRCIKRMLSIQPLSCADAYNMTAHICTPVVSGSSFSDQHVCISKCIWKSCIAPANIRCTQPLRCSCHFIRCTIEVQLRLLDGCQLQEQLADLQAAAQQAEGLSAPAPDLEAVGQLQEELAAAGRERDNAKQQLGR